jgi:hypothetical protein
MSMKLIDAGGIAKTRLELMASIFCTLCRALKVMNTRSIVWELLICYSSSLQAQTKSLHGTLFMCGFIELRASCLAAGKLFVPCGIIQTFCTNVFNTWKWLAAEVTVQLKKNIAKAVLHLVKIFLWIREVFSSVPCQPKLLRCLSIL